MLFACASNFKASARILPSRYGTEAGQETKEKGAEAPNSEHFDCAPVGIQTPNLLIRSQMLYSIELRARIGLNFGLQM